MLDDRDNKAYYNSFVDGGDDVKRSMRLVFRRSLVFGPLLLPEKSAIGYNIFIVQPDWD